jgi:4-amino-4-deoxy-L-arabinose transferase-like glycosyltransferase
MMIRRISQLRFEPSLVALGIFIWIASTAWSHALILPDEGRYVGVALEMLRSGNWLMPTLDGLPFFHKPPLFYWITSASMSMFGVNEWASRAGPIFGAWLGAFSMYMFMRRWRGDTAARMTTLALVSQPLFYIGGQFANMDMLVAGCITATVLMTTHAVLLNEQSDKFYKSLAGAYAMAGLGVMSKGLIGIVIPGLIIVTWLLILNRCQQLLKLIWLPGIVIFFTITAPWFIVMQLKFADFSHYFFMVQHFQRYVSDSFNNLQPFMYYPVVLFLSSLAWIPWMYRIFSPNYLKLSKQDPIRSLMWVWLAIVIVFFSIPQSKPLGYVLPAIVPLAFLLADSFTVLKTPSQRIKCVWFSSAIVSAALALGVVAWYSSNSSGTIPEMAKILKKQKLPHEHVFMLEQFFYDVPFYADISEPITVVDDWKSEDINSKDNWEKELMDAGLFSPKMAAHRLIMPLQLPAALCEAGVSWILVDSDVKRNYDMLNAAPEVSNQRGIILLRIDAAELEMSKVLDCSQNANKT